MTVFKSGLLSYRRKVKNMMRTRSSASFLSDFLVDLWPFIVDEHQR